MCATDVQHVLHTKNNMDIFETINPQTPALSLALRVHKHAFEMGEYILIHAGKHSRCTENLTFKMITDRHTKTDSIGGGANVHTYLHLQIL